MREARPTEYSLETVTGADGEPFALVMATSRRIESHGRVPEVSQKPHAVRVVPHARRYHAVFRRHLSHACRSGCGVGQEVEDERRDHGVVATASFGQRLVRRNQELH
jgi:hypothetical protein